MNPAGRIPISLFSCLLDGKTTVKRTAFNSESRGRIAAERVICSPSGFACFSFRFLSLSLPQKSDYD